MMLAIRAAGGLSFSHGWSSLVSAYEAVATAR
jgi:hypothetical protein